MKTIRKTAGMIILLTICISEIVSQKAGDPAPDFTYKNMSGVDVSLSSYKGKVVFLYLFGNGCPFCRASGNTTETLVQQVYGNNDDFQAFGLDLWDGSLTQVQAFQAETKLTYPLLLNAGSMTSKYSTTYDRVLVIDQEGVIRHKGTTPVSSGLDAAIPVIDELLTTTSAAYPQNKSVAGLEVVFPNPADDMARIRFTLDRKAFVRIRLLNTLGQEIRIVAREELFSGTHTRKISTSDLRPGIYLVQMEIPERSFSRKLIVKQ